jgi:hypothetical protein
MAKKGDDLLVARSGEPHAREEDRDHEAEQRHARRIAARRAQNSPTTSHANADQPALARVEAAHTR